MRFKSTIECFRSVAEESFEKLPTEVILPNLCISTKDGPEQKSITAVDFNRKAWHRRIINASTTSLVVEKLEADPLSLGRIIFERSAKDPKGATEPYFVIPKVATKFNQLDLHQIAALQQELHFMALAVEASTQ